MSDDDAFRPATLDSAPRWYSPWLHLAATFGIGVAVPAFVISRLHHVTALELLAVPAMFVLSNLGEYAVHKRVLHRRISGLTMLYDQHTPMHHRIYRYGDMEMREARETYLVLIPAAGVAGIVLVAALAAFAAGWLFTPNAGWLVLLTATVYVVSYEGFHLCYHLPERSLVYRLPFMKALREHHARHHDPRLMQRFNFNVTVPLGDLLFSTVFRR